MFGWGCDHQGVGFFLEGLEHDVFGGSCRLDPFGSIHQPDVECAILVAFVEQVDLVDIANAGFVHLVGDATHFVDLGAEGAGFVIQGE